MGVEVELSPRTRDGGRDILARKYDPTGNILVLAESKRHKNTINPVEVRALLGVVTDTKHHRRCAHDDVTVW